MILFIKFKTILFKILLTREMSQEPINQKNIFITGGTSGLGLELVKLFLQSGWNVVATGRQLLNLYGHEDKFKLFRVDFCDLNKVAQTMKSILHSIDHFDIVVNNAGILSPPDFTKTINGFEYTFQINFLSHLLINEIILREVKNNRPIKMVTVTSPVYRLADTDLRIRSDNQSYIALKAYASSKLCLTLMCEFLSPRYPGLNLQCFSFDPGTFRSGIYRMQKSWFRGMYHIASPFMKSPGKVANTLSEILISAEIKNGMICNSRNHFRTVPALEAQVKDTLGKDCYERIDHLLRAY